MTRSGRAVVAALVISAFAGVGTTYDAPRASSRPPQPRPQDAALPRPDAGPRTAAVPALQPSAPSRVSIASIDVDASVTAVHRGGGGSPAALLGVEGNGAGWLDGSVTPGESGSSVVLGRVATRLGPAVFHDLGALRKGNTIDVTRKDRTRATFTVYAVAVYPGDRFPAKRVYGNARIPELRVIGCAGYGRAEGHSGDVVAYARLTSTLR
ncbi:sortase domain-bontaining protein [Streptomyces sp. NBC_00859]|uniref:sortase domain-containing protein n=1 Tax=Streptomyces sp. NBC_00859 TaxID=2903682 RepID=UPI0038650704|nr:sortase [Streptomyces sp. NBC_00859]